MVRHGRGETMNLITVDFETFYDQSYSLSKLTTEAYIRHPDFETIGVSVKLNDSSPVWFSGTKPQTKAWLDQWHMEDAVVVAHNAMFDMAILNWHFDICPKRIVDTLSMARALLGGKVSVGLAALAQHYNLGFKGNEVIAAKGKRRTDFTSQELAAYGAYCCNDTELTYQLFLKLVVDYPLDELKLIDLTIRMFSEPVLELDQGTLQTHLYVIKFRKEAALLEAGASKKELMSNETFANLIRSWGANPPTKISPTTDKEVYAFAKTDEGMQALLEHPRVEVQALAAARLGEKSTLAETRTQRFVDICGRGNLPIPLSYCAAHTLRWGGSDKLNLQNLPKGTSPLKNAILAPEGYVFLDADASQIEARVLAWLAEQGDLVDAFEAGSPIYESMAADIYGMSVKDIGKKSLHRQVGKVTVLQSGFGSGGPKLRVTLKNNDVPVEVSEDEADHIIRTYRAKYRAIVALWRQAGQAIEAMAADRTAPFGKDGILSVEGHRGIKTPCGLYLRYENLRKHTFRDGKTGWAYDVRKGSAVIPKKIYGASLVENVVQHLARVVVGEQMLRISQRYKVALTVHDSIGIVVPEDEAKFAKEFVQLNMRLRPTWAPGLPLDCEANYGRSYGDC